MRLWSIHPKYLDPKGLVALWREALLGQAVLSGRTRGYTRHPQLERFQRHPRPDSLMARYLLEIWKEADDRGYSFDKTKISRLGRSCELTVMKGQLVFELQHLRRKLAGRDPSWLQKLADVKIPAPNPVFQAVKGSVESWERGNL